MNIFKRELRANMKSLLIWSGAQFFIIFSGMVKYDGYAKSGVNITDLFKDFPKGLQAVFGIGEIDLSKIEGYYSIFFIFFVLLAAIHAGMLGAIIMTKEERDHCADFLFSKPISRRRIITSKLLACLLNIFLFNMVTMFSSLFFISIYNNGNPLFSIVINLMIALFILQILFLSVGAVIGAFAKTAKKATSLTTAFLLGSFFLSLGIDIESSLKFLKVITPFQYFDAKKIVFGNAFEPIFVILSIAIVLAATITAYVQYEKRDLTT